MVAPHHHQLLQSQPEQRVGAPDPLKACAMLLVAAHAFFEQGVTDCSSSSRPLFHVKLRFGTGQSLHIHGRIPSQRHPALCSPQCKAMPSAPAGTVFSCAAMVLNPVAFLAWAHPGSSLLEFPRLSKLASHAVRGFWSLSSKAGLRPITWLGMWYKDTVFCFSQSEYPAVKGYVALTIDDGLCRQDPSKSMSEQVRQLLREYGAKATFFLCSEHVKGIELQAQAIALTEDGHEFGNHCTEDRGFDSASAAEFNAVLEQSSQTLEALLDESSGLRWFRAPQGKYTKVMRQAIAQRGMRHALADTYCDDWMENSDPVWIANTLLKQVRDGSVIIMHMPEKGFREHCYQALLLLLQGLTKKNMRVVTLSQLASFAEGQPNA